MNKFKEEYLEKKGAVLDCLGDTQNFYRNMAMSMIWKQ